MTTSVEWEGETEELAQRVLKRRAIEKLARSVVTIHEYGPEEWTVNHRDGEQTIHDTLDGAIDETRARYGQEALVNIVYNDERPPTDTAVERHQVVVFTDQETARQISCGCCTNGCVCHNHMDISRGVRPQRCALHSGTGEVVVLHA